MKLYHRLAYHKTEITASTLTESATAAAILSKKKNCCYLAFGCNHRATPQARLLQLCHRYINEEEMLETNHTRVEKEMADEVMFAQCLSLKKTACDCISRACEIVLGC